MLQEHVVLEPIAVRRPTAAKMLDCSESTVFKLEREGKLKTVKIGADRRITVASIKALLAPA
jgi:excisionase family DNA binding protein